MYVQTRRAGTSSIQRKHKGLFYQWGLGHAGGVNQWINTIEEEDNSQVPIRNQQACKAEVYSERCFQQLYLWQTELLVQKWKPCFFDGLEERITPLPPHDAPVYYSTISQKL